MTGLGVWANETQSEHEAVISEHTLSVIAAKELNCSYDDVSVLGYFDIPEDSPDRQINDTVYVQAFELEYRLTNPELNSRFGPWNHALYGITDEGQAHLWAN